jgi:hypothetical protein
MSFDSSFNQRGLIATEAILATARHGYDREAVFACNGACSIARGHRYDGGTTKSLT